jgi:hypothetical protein
LEWSYHDGGRYAAGFSQAARGDCLCRTIAIISDLPYNEVYSLIDEFGCKDRVTVWRQARYPSGAKSTAEKGVYKATAGRVLRHLGFVHTPTMGIGTGCRVHMREEELPPGRLVVSLSRHYTAVIDGVVYDTHDCTRSGNRCVYGYWTMKG